MSALSQGDRIMMNTERFLQNLFEGYVRTFSSFRWYTSANNADLTAKELNHFSELGERLGYIVRREMNWHYPRDLCWVDFDDTPFLYLERESKNSRMNHTVEKMLKKNGAIASLSLGAERKFSFKHKVSKQRVDIVLEKGSLLVMKEGTQTNWLHRLPPTKKVNSPRINLTFRTIEL